MTTHPLLIGAAKDQHEFYKNFPLAEETLVTVHLDGLVDQLRRNQWDLLVLDCGADLQLGLNLLEEIKPGFPDLPVLFLAESDSQETVISAFRLGARDYFHKPFDVLDLKSRIENLLRLKRGAKEKRKFVPLHNAERFLLREVQEGDYIPMNILKSVKFMENNLEKTLSLCDLAREAGLSRHHFCRIFGESMKMPPMKFLNFLRVQRAKQLLRRSDLSISRVAIRCGFGTLNSLTRSFKAFEGVTPSLFRASRKIVLNQEAIS